MALEKLRFLSTIPKVRLQDNRFVSADGNNALLIAHTPIEITDSRGARELLTHFQGLVDAVVPAHIEVSLISGHRYSAANAETIRSDLFVVLSCSFLAILALFLLYLRSWGAFFVFLVPVSVVCLAAVGVSLVYKNVSAVTIGFGSVLLGVSVDFAVHVYFALRHSKCDPAIVLAEVSRPVLFGGLTSLVAFGVLLFSNLPGQRQLAVFSMTGIAASLIMSLITLPHLIRTAPVVDRSPGARFRSGVMLPPQWILGGWMVLLVLCVWQGTHLRFDGDLRSSNLVTAEIRIAEDQLEQTWGNLRGRAIIFAGGPDLQSALETNDRLFAYLADNIPAQQITSLAPILPSRATQHSNRQRWTAFWAGEKGGLARTLLETEGEKLGFSSKAFVPFLERLSVQPVPIVPDDLRTVGLGEVLDSMIIQTDDKVQVLTLVPDSPEVAGLISRAGDGLEEVRLVSQTRFGENISKVLGRDFIQFIARASVAVILLLGVLFRNPKRVLYALVPVATGLIFMFGVMGWLNIQFNFTILADT